MNETGTRNSAGPVWEWGVNAKSTLQWACCDRCKVDLPDKTRPRPPRKGLRHDRPRGVRAEAKWQFDHNSSFSRSESLGTLAAVPEI